MQRKRYWMAAGIGAIMSVLVITSVAAQSGGIVQSISGGGPPSLTVGMVLLSPTSYSSEVQYSPGQLSYTVDAENGTTPGWTVTVQSGDLVYGGDNGGVNISAANLAVSTANAPGYVSGDLIDAGNGPFVPAEGATGALDQPRNVLVANPGYGHGVYSQHLDLTLTIPGGSKAGNYNGAITFTVSAGP